MKCLSPARNTLCLTKKRKVVGGDVRISRVSQPVISFPPFRQSAGAKADGPCHLQTSLAPRLTAAGSRWCLVAMRLVHATHTHALGSCSEAQAPGGRALACALPRIEKECTGMDPVG